MQVRLLASVLLLLLSAVGLSAVAPSNDNISNATPLSGTNITVTGSNIGATKEVGEPNHGEDPGGASVWWKWAAPAAGSVTIQTSGSSFDTLLAAYTGSSIATLRLIDNNDDTGSLKTSLVGFNVEAGATYLIAVDGYSAASGSIQLALIYRSTLLARPANDNFADRIALTGNTTDTTGSSFFASKERNEPNHADEIGGASVWWTWTTSVPGTVEISTLGSNFDTVLGVYTGSALTNLLKVASSDDVSTNQPTSLVTFKAQPNTPYQIAVDGYDGEPGDIQLHISLKDLIWLNPPKPLPPNGHKLILTAPIGKQYALDASSNLIDWTRVSALPNSTGTVEFIDSTTGSLPRRFYRAQQLAQ